MEDLTISARERFLERLKSREDFITIPMRGTKVLSFNHRLNSPTGIEVHVEVDDRSRKSYKLGDVRRKIRKYKIPIDRIDIGLHPDVRAGLIYRDVGEDHHPTLADTLQFVNLYLGYNISVEDINERFFDTRNRLLTLRIRKNCLKYTGQVRVVLV